MEIHIIKDKVTAEELRKYANESFGDMVKAVVDIEKRIMALGGELHSDGEAFLIEDGSDQKNLWGINIYPESPKEEMIVYTSLINIRPSQGSRSMEIKDEMLKKNIADIIFSLIA